MVGYRIGFYGGGQLALVAQDAAGRQVKLEGSAVSEASAVGVLENAKPESGGKPVEAAASAPVVFFDEQRYPTHYWLWAAVGSLMLGGADGLAFKFAGAGYAGFY